MAPSWLTAFVVYDPGLAFVALWTGPFAGLKGFGVLGYRQKGPVALWIANPEKRAEWVAEKGRQVFQVVSDELMDCHG